MEERRIAVGTDPGKEQHTLGRYTFGTILLYTLKRDLYTLKRVNTRRRVFRDRAQGESD